MVAQSDIIVDSFYLKPTMCYCRVTAEKYEASSPIGNDKASSPVEKYEVVSPININKMIFSKNEYETLLPLNKDTASLPIKNDTRINGEFLEKNMVKPISALT